ncbi:MAG TPA: hypothetical protein PKD64_16020 [Pirellulaceae bacterium]|nr:hypothetical protein [Pirellulaceae bacterium]HMO93695.1 hypothetical protein [Pirellulaceae bacterium]HMP71272.1 hypothetical protein [Pirellulaceae bacterium]
MAKNQLLLEIPSGEWKGFFLEKHQPNRGWMHLYLVFDANTMKGEGTDYVGPWHILGHYDDSGQVQWTKRYLGKHQVHYRGQYSEKGIVGEWTIHNTLTGPFHIWPKSAREMDEYYLANEVSLEADQLRESLEKLFREQVSVN